jgi:hypothetical protein
MGNSLSQILAVRPAASIDDVVRIMTAIDGRLPDDDGLKWFNRLYLEVTLAVKSAVTKDANSAANSAVFTGFAGRGAPGAQSVKKNRWFIVSSSWTAAPTGVAFGRPSRRRQEARR